MNKDVIIIGGGILGCAMAYSLSHAGLRVVLLERGTLAQGTTGNSFAWANASSKVGDKTYHDLNAAGVDGYRALASEHGAERLGIYPTGALYTVSRSDPAGFRAMQSEFETLTGYGYPCEWLDGPALAAADHGLTLPADAEAILFPSDLVVDAPKATQCFAELSVAAGAEIKENCAALSLIANDEGTVEGVETSSGPVQAPRVILACGADTGRVLAELTGFDGFATRFPLREVPGLLLTTPKLDPNPLTRIYFGSTTDELHLLPAANGGIRIGSDDVDSIIWEDRSDAAMRCGGEAILDRAAAVIPDLRERVSLDDCTLQIGVRPYPEDGKSIIGPLPNADGVFVVATHSGITLAPVIAEQMAKLLTTGDAPTLRPFGLVRFAGF